MRIYAVLLFLAFVSGHAFGHIEFVLATCICVEGHPVNISTNGHRTVFYSICPNFDSL